MMRPELHDRTIAFLLAPEGVEEAELTEPWRAVASAGGQPVLVSTRSGQAQAYRHLDPAARFDIDAVVDDVRAAQFDALVLPGGVVNADTLRIHDGAVRFVRDITEAGRPVAVICHGPWALIEAGAVTARTMTSWPSLRTDIANAGGVWVDEEVVVDTNGPGPVVSSRKPDDLPAFCTRMLETISAAAPPTTAH